MDFEPPEARNIFAPLLTEQALSDIPLFGPEKADAEELLENVLTTPPEEQRLVVDVSADNRTISFDETSSIADKLKTLRLNSKSEGKQEISEDLLSQLERHEKLLSGTRDLGDLSSKARYVVDHIMLLRAKEGYRFDFVKNQEIVADDPWLKDVWAWVAGELAPDSPSNVRLIAHNIKQALRLPQVTTE